MRVFENKKFKKAENDVFGSTFGSHQAGQELHVFKSKRVYDNFIQNCKIRAENVTHLRKKRAILPEKSMFLARKLCITIRNNELNSKLKSVGRVIAFSGLSASLIADARVMRMGCHSWSTKKAIIFWFYTETVNTELDS